MSNRMTTDGGTLWWKTLLPGIVLAGVCGCSLSPLREISSLSPAVEADTVAYNDALGNTQDQILLTNILRAKDYAPLNLSQLSSISGALSLSGTLGFTLPFGYGQASGHASTSQVSAAPSVTTSTTPTYTVTPLNTSGFTLAIIQPIAPIYVQSLLQQGFPPEVLLSLFVKEIDLPDSYAGVKRYVNDPDNSAYSAEFEGLVDDLVANGLSMKTVDVLEPVGPAFDLHVASTTTVSVAPTSVFYNPTTEKACAGKEDDTHPDRKGCIEIKPVTGGATVQQLPYPSRTVNADQQGYTLVTTSGDAQYHVGNSGSNQGQLYRIYSGQFLMCVARGTKNHTIPRGIRIADQLIPRTDSDAVISAHIELHSVQKLWRGAPIELFSFPIESAVFHMSEQASDALHDMIRKVAAPIDPMGSFAAPLGGAASPAAPSASAGGGSGKGGGAGGGNSAGGGSVQGVIPVLQAPRISAIVSGNACQSDQIVLPQISDSQLQSHSAQFVHIYWRSLSDIFQYLGAVLRHDQGRTYPVYVFPDTTIQGGEIAASTGTPVTLFATIENGTGDLKVRYNSSTYAIANPKAPKTDFTRPILTILSTLVNVASQQNISPSSAPIRFLPLP